MVLIAGVFCQRPSVTESQNPFPLVGKRPIFAPTTAGLEYVLNAVSPPSQEHPGTRFRLDTPQSSFEFRFRINAISSVSHDGRCGPES